MVQLDAPEDFTDPMNEFSSRRMCTAAQNYGKKQSTESAPDPSSSAVNLE